MTGDLSDALITAVKNDDICISLQLLDSGVNAFGLDSDGWSLLQHACVNSSTSSSLLSHLLRLGLPVNHTDSDGRTALHWAARDNKADQAAVLLAAGADYTARTATGFTPLDWAIVTNQPECVRVLFSYGATRYRQKEERLKLLLEMKCNETEREWLELMGVPFFVELCMKETFPDLHAQLQPAGDVTNPYEELVTDKVSTENKVKFLRLAKRCLRISSHFRAKALTIETLLLRKYSSYNRPHTQGYVTTQTEEKTQPLVNIQNDKYHVLEQIVFEVEKRCGMQW